MNQIGVSETVAWLPDLPNHWGRKRFKLLFRLMGGGTPSKEQPEYWIGDVPWVSSKDMKVDVIFDTEDHISEDAVRESATNVVPEGTILIVARSGILRHTIPVAITGRPVAINQDIKAAIPRSGGLEPRYFAFLIKGFQDQLLTIWRSQGATVESLDTEIIGNTDVPVPPLPEQCAIADFLDRETAKIDALTFAQKQLIELLKEKCQAAISNAVTKGLSPTVRMKSSGTDWLGDVPEGWSVLPLKRIVSVPITDGPHETPQFFNEGVPFVSAEAVSSGRIDFSKIRACISPEDNLRYSKKYSPKRHDIYMVKSGATTGITAMVEDRTDFNIWSPLAAIRCNSNSLPQFVLQFMRSRQFLDAVSLYWSFGTQQNIGMGVIENLACTVPPLAEQAEIVDFLEAELSRLETLISGGQRVIDLLAEHRSSLITAAVTGQIEVAAHIAAEAAA